MKWICFVNITPRHHPWCPDLSMTIFVKRRLKYNSNIYKKRHRQNACYFLSKLPPKLLSNSKRLLYWHKNTVAHSWQMTIFIDTDVIWQSHQLTPIGTFIKNTDILCKNLSHDCHMTVLYIRMSMCQNANPHQPPKIKPQSWRLGFDVS